MATHELVLELTLEGSKEKYFLGWTQPELLKRWFAPAPFTVSSAEMDLKPGGACNVTMRSPEGVEMPNPGVVLEVVPNKKLVFTDAFTAGFVPKDGAPFMVTEVTFEDAGPGMTKYVAKARHWTAEAKAQHEQMGFREGWTQCAKQLEALVRSL
ncbi:MAG: SRPBCC family protein [Archangium sp.]